MKKVFMISYLVFFFLILTTCAQKVDENNPPILDEDIQQVDLVKAKQLLETTCISCHSATAPEDSRLAPPLEAVKRRYLMAYPTLDEFTSNVVSFVSEPTEEKSMMFGAIQRFNLMPPVPFPEEDLKAIATYIYQFELERPEWFEEHYQEMHGEGGMGNGQGRRMRRGQGGN